jgi:predicted DCC family thiol-disulfide oxidoreductase YuxK
MNIILFDGVCNLCNKLVLFLIKHDKNCVFQFSPLQTSAGEKLIHQYHLLNDNKSVILIKDGIVFYKSDAIIEIAKKMTGWPQLLKYSFLFPKFLRDGIYDLIAKNRYYLFGQQASCPIPSEDAKKRYLL